MINKILKLKTKHYKRILLIISVLIVFSGIFLTCKILTPSLFDHRYYDGYILKDSIPDYSDNFRYICWDPTLYITVDPASIKEIETRNPVDFFVTYITFKRGELGIYCGNHPSVSSIPNATELVKKTPYKIETTDKPNSTGTVRVDGLIRIAGYSIFYIHYFYQSDDTQTQDEIEKIIDSIKIDPLPSIGQINSYEDIDYLINIFKYPNNFFPPDMVMNDNLGAIYGLQHRIPIIYDFDEEEFLKSQKYRHKIATKYEHWYSKIFDKGTITHDKKLDIFFTGKESEQEIIDYIEWRKKLMDGRREIITKTIKINEWLKKFVEE